MTPATKQFNVRLSHDVIYRLKQLRQDPVTKKTRYGAMSELVEKLLWDWILTQNPKATRLTKEERDEFTNNSPSN